MRAAGLSLNANKSKVIVFSRKQIPLAVNIHVYGNVIPVVDSTRFLGVTISKDLKWNTHITNTCAKARQQLEILHRLFGLADSATLSHLYKVLILPTFDYCSAVWDPAAVSLTNRLASVQRLAARLTTKRWHTPPDDLTNLLNWTSLKTRRKRQKVMVCARIVKGLSIIPSSYLAPHPRPNVRHHHSYPLLTPFARTSAYQSSFFIDCTHLWNGLPDDIICATSAFSFKRRLKTILTFFLDLTVCSLLSVCII